MTTMPQYKLYYFPLRCRAEPARLLFAYSGTKFDDKIIDFSEWPSVKPQMPMGQLPVLDVGGKMLCQSTAIARYLAREFGLAGKSNLEAARADMLVDGVFDLWGNIRPVYMALFANETEKFKECWAKFRQDYLNSFLTRYTKFVKDGQSGWLVGDSITWADIVVSEFLSVLQDCFDADVLADYEILKDYMEKVQNLPQLRDYLASRPKYPF